MAKVLRNDRRHIQKALFTLLFLISAFSINYLSSNSLVKPTVAFAYEVIPNGQFGVWGVEGNDTLHLNDPYLHDVTDTNIAIFDRKINRIVLIDRESLNIEHIIHKYQYSNGTRFPINDVQTISIIDQKLAVYDDYYKKLFLLHFNGTVIKYFHWNVSDGVFSPCLITTSNNLLFVCSYFNNSFDGEWNVSAFNTNLELISSLNVSTIFVKNGNDNAPYVDLGMQIFTLENGTIMLPFTFYSGLDFNYLLLNFNPTTLNWSVFVPATYVLSDTAPLSFTYSDTMNCFVCCSLGVFLYNSSQRIGQIIDLPGGHKAMSIGGIYCDGDLIFFTESKEDVLIIVKITDTTPSTTPNNGNEGSDDTFFGWLMWLHKTFNKYIPGGLWTLSVLIVCLIGISVVAYIRSIKKARNKKSEIVDEAEL
ncbi:MAG: hypothetical protein ACTSYD_07520 [Candidatus Heimdallarchaeaceae archaeon]